MNPARVNEIDLINFMIASQKVFSATEASRSMSLLGNQVAHDAYTRLLTRLEPDPVTLWNEVVPLVIKTQGVLIVDDSTLDKPYATEIELVSHHWSVIIGQSSLVSHHWSVIIGQSSLVRKTSSGRQRNQSDQHGLE